MADMNDLEGGGVYGGGSAPNSGNLNVSSGNNRGLEAPGGYDDYGYDSGKASKRTYHRRGGYQSLLVGAAGSMSNAMLQKCIAVLGAVILLGAFALPLQMKILWLVYGAVVFGAMVSMWLSKNVLSCDDGTKEMRAVVRVACRCECSIARRIWCWFFTPRLMLALLLSQSDPIREGAEGFLHVQYTVSLAFRNRPGPGCWYSGLTHSVSFSVSSSFPHANRSNIQINRRLHVMLVLSPYS